ncbi:unnamed protein product [Amoebophrya sp. A25]|nr:unnamed protein product [Amoebophrya sp. A25]|eukprot:GSA25T00016444001.1
MADGLQDRIVALKERLLARVNLSHEVPVAPEAATKNLPDGSIEEGGAPGASSDAVATEQSEQPPATSPPEGSADAVQQEEMKSPMDEEVDSVLAELEPLTLSHQLLKTTLIGKVMRDVSMDAKLSEDVKKKAAALIEKWKKTVLLSQKSSRDLSAATSTSASSSSTNTGATGAASNKFPFTPVTGNGHDLPAERERESRRLPAVKPMSTQELLPDIRGMGSSLTQSQDFAAGDDPRMILRIKLEKALSYAANETESKILEGEEQLKTEKQLASEIEQVLYNKLKEKRDYAHQSRSILTNLRDAKNRDFKLRVRLGAFKPEQMATLTTNDMASDEKNAEREKTRKDAMEEIDLDYDKKRAKISSSFTCGKCGTNKCTYYQLQTRSSDEPMTTFVTCMTCNNRWKFC